MQFKKYLLLDAVENHNYVSGMSSSLAYFIKPKILTGFTQADAMTALNVQRGWQPKENDKLFFFGGCTVPRFKVREKFVVTIKPTKATAAFVSKNSLTGSDETFGSESRLLPISKDSVNAMMNKYKDADAATMIKSIVSNDSIEGVFIARNYWEHFMWTSGAFYPTTKRKNNDTTKEHLYYWLDITNNKYDSNKPENNLLLFQSNAEINQMTCPIYLQEDILLMLNDGKLIIDEKKYEELRTFGNNGDKDNLVLMMELMANSDFDKSFVHLLFLLKEFGYTIKDFREAEHVNFKALLNFMGLTKSHLASSHINLNIHKMSNSLKQRKQFTKSNATSLAILCASDNFDPASKENKYWKTGAVINLQMLNSLDKE